MKKIDGMHYPSTPSTLLSDFPCVSSPSRPFLGVSAPRPSLMHRQHHTTSYLSLTCSLPRPCRSPQSFTRPQILLSLQQAQLPTQTGTCSTSQLPALGPEPLAGQRTLGFCLLSSPHTSAPAFLARQVQVSSDELQRGPCQGWAGSTRDRVSRIHLGSSRHRTLNQLKYQERGEGFFQTSLYF